MKVLVACEFSGVVREEFRKKGHDAWSCDLLDSLDNSEYHIKGDVIELLENTKGEWDLIIAHPPCTYLAVSGNRSYSNRSDLYLPAIDFAKVFFNYSERVCVENPVGRLSSFWRKPNQYVQPWMFGHKEQKKTGLWLKNLPLLQQTDNVYEEMMKLSKKEREKIWYMSPSKERSNLRSITYRGIAEAMAEQWG